MKTGTTVITTGVYRSDCSCAAQIEAQRGSAFPRCPKCQQPVTWVYQRSSYVPPPDVSLE